MITQKTIVAGPSIYPVSLQHAKEHMRLGLDFTDDDEYLKLLIATATAWVEQYCARKLIQQTWQVFYDKFPGEKFITVPFGQLSSVTHVKYTDSDEDTTTWTDTEYIVDTDSDPGRIVLEFGESWPSFTKYPSNPIEVQFVCGYGTTRADVPEPIRHALKLKIAELYEQREPFIVGTIHTKLDTIANLLQDYRLFDFEV